MSRTQRLCDLVDALIGPISCDESIETHNVRMAVRDCRDEMRPATRAKAPLFDEAILAATKKGRAA